jgi:two-component system chemotaxis response regulator CheB
MNDHSNIVIIGGSAGCLHVLIQLLKNLPKDFNTPVVIVMHRQRNVVSEMKHILTAHSNKQIIEPDDKHPIETCCIYLAPQNYHLLIEVDHTFSLDYSEVVRYSRPSIDVTFESGALVYGEGVIGILLSGANNDGAIGLKTITDNKGIAIVQSPSTAEYPAMPQAAIGANKLVQVMDPEEISTYLHSINSS